MRSISVVGAALTPEPAVSKGFTIERSDFTLDGKPVELESATGGTSEVAQNERLVIVVKVTTQNEGGRVLVVDRLPAGLEIENPRLVDGGDIKALDWLKTTSGRSTPSSAMTASSPRSTSPAATARRMKPRRHDDDNRLHGARGDARLVSSIRRPRSRTCIVPSAMRGPLRAGLSSRPAE